MKAVCSIIFIASLLTSCNDPDTSIKEITRAEKDFEKMAADSGIARAFYFYADTGATIKRQHDTLIHGKEAILNYYSADYFKTAKVSWSPDFIDASGEIGYTYGKYRWLSKDSSGKEEVSTGIFHTVWKKQPKGDWKYVWD